MMDLPRSPTKTEAILTDLPKTPRPVRPVREGPTPEPSVRERGTCTTSSAWKELKKRGAGGGGGSRAKSEEHLLPFPFSIPRFLFFFLNPDPGNLDL